MDQIELVYHWHARAMQYIILNANNIDALSMITLLRRATEAAAGTFYHTRLGAALNNVKASVKKAELTPTRLFNYVAGALDNPEIPEQHFWAKNHADTLFESIINNLHFNNVTAYCVGWPIQFIDHPDSLVPGEAKGKTISLSNGP